MHVVIRRFEKMVNVRAAAQRAETGLVARLEKIPGFLAYVIFDGGDGSGGSVSFFGTVESAKRANTLSLAWAQASLTDLYDGVPDVLIAEVIYATKGAREITGSLPHESPQVARGVGAKSIVSRPKVSDPRSVTDDTDLTEALKLTFPASDPVSMTQPHWQREVNSRKRSITKSRLIAGTRQKS
jgi:hypothetical protein